LAGREAARPQRQKANEQHEVPFHKTSYKEHGVNFAAGEC
jgi:hypothetical protein